MKIRMLNILCFFFQIDICNFFYGLCLVVKIFFLFFTQFKNLLPFYTRTYDLLWQRKWRYGSVQIIERIYGIYWLSGCSPKTHFRRSCRIANLLFFFLQRVLSAFSDYKRKRHFFLSQFLIDLSYKIFQKKKEMSLNRCQKDYHPEHLQKTEEKNASNLFVPQKYVALTALKKVRGKKSPFCCFQ